MRKETIIAYSITFLVFIGGGIYLFGSPSWFDFSRITFPDFMVSEPIIEEEVTNKKTKPKKGKYKKESKIAKVVDKLNGVNIYYNGRISNVMGRSVTKDGYNLGLKYQCVEFVKRYYYKHLNHKMPDTYGHAKDLFDSSLDNGALNKARGLFQFRNITFNKPQVNDILIFGANKYNAFGHVAIVSKVTNDHIQIIQQNPGPKNSSRAEIPLVNRDGLWELRGADILGWLRK